MHTGTHLRTRTASDKIHLKAYKLKEDRRRHSVSLFTSLNWWPHVARPWAFRRSRVSSEAMDSRPHLSLAPPVGVWGWGSWHTQTFSRAAILCHMLLHSVVCWQLACVYMSTHVLINTQLDNQFYTWMEFTLTCIMQTCRLIGVQLWLPLDLQFVVALFENGIENYLIF